MHDGAETEEMKKPPHKQRGFSHKERQAEGKACHRKRSIKTAFILSL